ncbi:MAG: AraC family transcriptional regulator [Clostridium celatum]|nr:AraC family transcriptional regulator [Clostridium celatum]
MIETLNGIKETINFTPSSHSRIHDNTVCEDYPPHWHLELEIIIPIENCYDVIIENKNYHLDKHDILFINSGIVHSIKSPISGKRYILQFDLSPLCQFKEFESALYILPPVLLLTHQSSIYPIIHDLINTIINEYKNNDVLSEALIYSILIQIYVNLSRNEVYKRINSDTTINKQHEYIEKLLFACNYITSHYNDDLTLEDVASVIGFSKYHFSRLFKQFTNMTFYNYLIAQRISKAELMLANSDLRISDIAMNTGFSSISTFNRIFKSAKGCSPNDFRKSIHRSKPILNSKNIFME